MKKRILFLHVLFCMVLTSFQLDAAKANPSKLDEILTDAKAYFVKKDGSYNEENIKNIGIGALTLGLMITVPVYINSTKKINIYQKMLNIHYRFVEVFPYFETWKKTKSKADLIKLINDANKEALVFEHQQARYLYNALQNTVKIYNDTSVMLQYIIKKKISLEKLTDLDAALDFLRIFIKKSELIVTETLIEKISQDPYFSFQTKSTATKAAVLFPHLLDEKQALFSLQNKLYGISLILTPYKEFLLSRKVSPTRDVLLQTINTLLHKIKKDLDFFHLPTPTTATSFAPIHAPINPSNETTPEPIPNIMPLKPVVTPEQQVQTATPTSVTNEPKSLVQKIKDLFIRPVASKIVPLFQQTTPQETPVITPVEEQPKIETLHTVETTPSIGTPVVIPQATEQVETALSEEEAKKAQLKKYATIGLLAGGTLLLTGVIAAGIATK